MRGDPQFEDRVPEDLRTIYYADLGQRSVAALIDGGILLAAFTVIFVIALLIKVFFMPEEAPTEWWQVAIILAIFLFIVWIYKAGFESSSEQATYGKRVLRIYVADEKGRRISLARASLRAWPWYFVFFNFLFAAVCIPIVFTQRKQALHDMMAKCVVVRARF